MESMEDLVNLNFESGWKIIKEEAIDKIEKYIEDEKSEIKENLFSAKEYTRLYTVVYNLCARKSPHCYSKEVYRKYGECLSEYIVVKVKPLLKNTTDYNKIKFLIDAWIKYSFYTRWMNKFLRYLDRYYVEYNCSLCLSAYTKNIFKITLFNDLRDVSKEVIYNMYESIRNAQEERERKREKQKGRNNKEKLEKFEGEEKAKILERAEKLDHEEREREREREREKREKEREERHIFCDLVQLYKELDRESKDKMYEQDIEKKILENVDAYYKKNVDKWVMENSFDDYIRLIENCIEKEYDKNKSLYLIDDTCEKVTNIIVKILIFDKLDYLLSNKSNIYDLLKYKKLGCLRRTYILFSYFPKAIKGLKQLIGEYVKAEGAALKQKYVTISKNISMKKPLLSNISLTNDTNGTNRINEKNGIIENNVSENNNNNDDNIVGNLSGLSNFSNISNFLNLTDLDSLKDPVFIEKNKDQILCGYIEELIRLHNYYDEVFKVSFYNISNESIDINFKECLKEYFETFVEHEDEHFSTVKLLVLYADRVLKYDENSLHERALTILRFGKMEEQTNNWNNYTNDYKNNHKYVTDKKLYIDKNYNNNMNYDNNDRKTKSAKTFVNTSAHGNRNGNRNIMNVMKETEIEEGEEEEEDEEGDDTNYINLMNTIADIVEIFNYTSNKESFFEYYRIYLANRLISNVFISLELEKKFVQNLYCLYGSQFTSKLGGMIQDIINNENINKKFLDFYEKKCIALGTYDNDYDDYNDYNDYNNDEKQFFRKKNIRNTFSVQILNKGYWPPLEKISIQLNKEFSQNIQLFEEHYKSENKNKKLEWSFDISEVILEYIINNDTYILFCNVINAHILLLLNNYEYINYELVQKELQIDLKTFMNNMNTCVNEAKIIYSKDSTINWESSNFYINENFNSPRKSIFMKKSTAVSSKEHEKATEDRSMAIEAAIVRVMKMHKTLFYDQIFEYVKKALAQFAPSNQAIQQKIDLLLEREYIQKEENSQLYMYVP